MTKNDVMIYLLDADMTSCRVLVPHTHFISALDPFGLHLGSSRLLSAARFGHATFGFYQQNSLWPATKISRHTTVWNVDGFMTGREI